MCKENPAEKYREELLSQIHAEYYEYGESENLSLLDEEFDRVKKGKHDEN